MTGYCLDHNGKDQNSGGYPNKGEPKKRFDTKEECGNYCLSAIGELATGCEYNDKSKICQIHDHSVMSSRASGGVGMVCYHIPPNGWLFSFTSFRASGYIVSIFENIKF